MQFPGMGKPPAGVVFDSAMDRIDDALALALLYGLDGKNELRVAAVTVSRFNLQAAAFCDAVARFYAGPPSPFGFGRILPVGLSTAGKPAPDTPMLSVPLARQNADGKPTYPCAIHKLNDTAEVDAFIRNAFTAQYDQNAMAVLAGPATDLASLLDMPGVLDLIKAKVRLLAVVAADFNLRPDIPAARKLFAEWPTPIVAVGPEIGEALRYPAASIEKDFAWSPAHPVVDAYRAGQTMPYDAPTHAMAALLYAARAKEGYFQLSEPGAIRVSDDGRASFSASPEGRHRQLILDPTQQNRIIKAYTEIASAKPVPRRFRFQKKQQDQKQQPPAKPPAP